MLLCCRSVVSYKTTKMPIYSLDTVNKAEKIGAYDSLDAEVTQSYMEYSLASLIYYAMKEGACSEQSARMTAMDAASKNAGMFIFFGSSVGENPILNLGYKKLSGFSIKWNTVSSAFPKGLST